MKKKFGAAIVAGVMACSMTVGLAFSSGCATKVPEFEMPDGGYDGRAVEITFANTTGANLEGVVNSALERFNVLYPNISVHVDNTNKNWDDFADNIATRLTSQKQPNVAFCYSDHVATYNKANAVLAIDDFLPGGAFENMTVTNTAGTEPLGYTQAQVDDFIEAFFAEGSVYGDGKTYTLPFAKSTEVLFYNKTAFTKWGLTVPTTWEEMEATCAQIIEKANDEKTIALGYDSEANLFITLCEQYGSPYTSATGDHFLFDNEKNHEFVEMLKRWYDSRYLTTKETYGEYSSNLFKAETCYMSIGSTGGSSYQDPGITDGTATFEVGVAPIPQVDPSNPKTILQGPSVCIFKKADPYEVLASWLLVKFLTTEIQFQGAYSEISGYTPVIKSVFENPAYQEFLSEADSATGLTARTSLIGKQMAEDNAFYTSPAFVGSSKAREQVGLLVKTYLQNEDPNRKVEEFFAAAIFECNYFAGN